VIFRLESSSSRARVAGLDTGTTRTVLGQFTEGFDERTERDRRDYLATLLRMWPGELLAEDLQRTLAAVIELLRGPVKNSDVILRQTGEEQARVVIADRRRAAADDDLRQVFTLRAPDEGPVLLDDHQGYVAARAQMLAEQLGLTEDITGVLRHAGAHHDDGKADPRFQVVRLGATDGGPLLAKSDPTSTARQVRERQAQAGLPGRWRHEQRSVADSWVTLHAAPGIDPLLAARLVGTSHGHGRTGFPHTASQLAAEHDTGDWVQQAIGLFDDGGWDELIETTHIRYGVRPCSGPPTARYPRKASERHHPGRM
jgi:CRISPR-associated endonuclease/helicase Cas3